jgi:ABC-type nickel/cobalt efflux system permease component RcnA
MALVAAVMALPASAQQQPAPQKSPLGITLPSDASATSQRGLTAGRPPLATPPVAAPEPVGPLGRAWAWIETQRAQLNRTMAAAVRSLKTEPLGAALLSLIGICFAYGVLHAAGPGHGKGVISAYALANNETLKRGVLLSFMAALFQAFTAISVFLVLSLMLGARKGDFDRTEAWLETLSWALVAGIGAWLLYTRVVPLLGLGHRADDAQAAHGRAHGHPPAEHARAHGHHHGPVHLHALDHHHHGHAHHHHHAHDAACADCGHMHMPTPEQVQGQWSWRKAFGIAAAVGVRPCTGALILLAFCAANGLLWAGVLGTLAMSLGTAITISVLAVLAVGARDWARVLAGGDSPWGARVATAAGILGSALVLVMGSTFFVMSLKAPAPF